MNYWIIPAIDRVPQVDKLVNKVCNHFEISKTQLKSKSRLRRFVMAREVITYILDKRTELSDVEIGKIINRHRTNVIATRIKMEKYLSVDKQYRELINKFI